MKTIRSSLSLPAVLLLALAATGCEGSTGSATPAVTTTVTATVTQPPVVATVTTTRPTVTVTAAPTPVPEAATATVTATVTATRTVVGAGASIPPIGPDNVDAIDSDPVPAGNYRVGEDISTGLFYTPGPVSGGTSCHYALTSYTGAIIDEQTSSGALFARLEDNIGGFQTSGCRGWRRIA